MKSIKHFIHNLASLHIQKHFNFVSPPGACGGGEFWLAGRRSLLGNVALPDAVVTTKTHPQNQWPDNRGAGGWVCEVTDRVSDWERDKAIKTSLGWLSGKPAGLIPGQGASSVCVPWSFTAHIQAFQERKLIILHFLWTFCAWSVIFQISSFFKLHPKITLINPKMKSNSVLHKIIYC